MLNGQTSKKNNSSFEKMERQNRRETMGGENIENSEKSSFNLPNISFSIMLFQIIIKLINEYQGRLYEGVDFKLDDGSLNYRTFGDYFSEGFRQYFEDSSALKVKNIDLYNFFEGILK